MSFFKAFKNNLNVFNNPQSKSNPLLSKSTDLNDHHRKASSDDNLITFQSSWLSIKNLLSSPTQRLQPLASTPIKEKLETLSKSLINHIKNSKSTHLNDHFIQADECIEYFFQNDIPGNLVSLSLPDQPIGVKGLVIQFFLSLVLFFDHHDLFINSKVHKPLVRLLRSCLQPQFDPDETDQSISSFNQSSYEEASLELLCHLCSRIKSCPELLLIFVNNRPHPSQSHSISDPINSSSIATSSILSSISPSTHSALTPNQSSQRKSVHFSPKPKSSSPTPSILSGISSSIGHPAQPILNSSLSSLTQSVKDSSASQPLIKTDSDILIFSYLLRFLHREGRAGDLARAGLLFLMELAISPSQPSKLDHLSHPSQSISANHLSSTSSDSISIAFAEWVLDSDFADVLGASLGAAYGLLPTKLLITPRNSNNGDSLGGMVLGGMGTHFSNHKTENDQTIQEKERQERRHRLLTGLGVSDSSEFRVQIDLFLKLIEFTQDIMRSSNPSSFDHSIPSIQPTLPPPTNFNPSSSSSSPSFAPIQDSNNTSGNLNQIQLSPSPAEIVASAILSTILLSIRKLFLNAIIYPSLLECSEFDGSAVAVMSYLEAIFSLLETDGELADNLLRFLMAEDDQDLDIGLNKSKLTQTRIMQLESSSTVKSSRRKSGAVQIIQAEFNKAKPGHHHRLDESGLMSDTGITYFNSLGRFTLKDLLFNNIQSSDPPTATAALKLFHVILVRHDRYALALLDIIPDPNATAFPFPHDFEDLQSESSKADSQESEEEFVYPTDPQPSSNDKTEEEEFIYPGADKDLQNTSISKAGPSKFTSFVTPSKSISNAQPIAPNLTPSNVNFKKPSLALAKKMLCSPCPTYQTHRDGLNYLSSMIELIDPSSLVIKVDTVPESLSTGFGHYLLDAEAELTSTATFRRGLLIDYVRASVRPMSETEGERKDSCFSTAHSYNPSVSKRESNLDLIDHPVIRHRLSPDTSLMSSLIESLTKFFLQPPELNLILTGCIATLASCPTRSLEGWMLPSFTNQQEESYDQLLLLSHSSKDWAIDDDDGDDRSIDFAVGEYASSIHKTSAISRRTTNFSTDQKFAQNKGNSVLEVYRQLAEQVVNYRKTINKFDSYLTERRQGLIFVENLEDALDTLTNPPLIKTDEPGLALKSVNPLPQVVNERVNIGPIESQSKSKDSSFLISFFKATGPKPPLATNHTHPSTSSEQVNNRTFATPERKSTYKPFSEHYQKTGSIKLHVTPVTTPNFLKKRSLRSNYDHLNGEETDDEDDFSRGPETPTRQTEKNQKTIENLLASKETFSNDKRVGLNEDHYETVKGNNDKIEVSLSMLLDNIVILEESIKEFRAIISFRKSLGIDQVRII
ncbi:hypothetical protein O181_039527 [Austropuccinia psidii MF-1]|uniref:FHF complex subunit HOOK-interacting protein C-terminal domain-containing protein n=1 Tax=Austropuccinia psidii MF-1 TaxID=1389203 RepID=A0A9Q3HD00_9BASI|nr:hypothetical protein [Austropuccinia psidii MF-1]